MRILRGRVVVREEKKLSTTIWTPDEKEDEQRIHRGVVLGVGEGAFTKKGVPVDPGVLVGESVYFHFEGTEKGRTALWTDGKPALYLAQREVDAVVES